MQLCHPMPPDPRWLGRAMPTPPMPVSANAPTKGVAVAITRLRSDATFDDALVFVHEMYTALNISTSMLIAALGLGQSLIMRWSDWRLGLAMGLSLVFKLTRSLLARPQCADPKAPTPRAAPHIAPAHPQRRAVLCRRLARSPAHQAHLLAARTAQRRGERARCAPHVPSRRDLPEHSAAQIRKALV